jgi:hypothetical protein
MKLSLSSADFQSAELWGLALAMALQISLGAYQERKADMLRQTRAQMEFEWPEAAPAAIEELLVRFTLTALQHCEIILGELDI